MLLSEHSDTVDADRLATLSDEINYVVSGRVDGDIVEVGSYRGATALWMRAVLSELGNDRQIHVYDSFQGLPAPGEYDSAHLAEGELGCSTDQLVALHGAWNMPAPTIHPGWFAHTLPIHLPAQIAFGYLDGDFYESIQTSLTHCVPRLTPGASLIIDDYADTLVNPRAWNGLPGVKKAVDDYFGFPSPIEVLFGEGDLAFGRYRSPLGGPR